MLYVGLVGVLHIVSYMRYFAVWVCGFVNCGKFFDPTKFEKKVVYNVFKEKRVKSTWNLEYICNEHL